MRLARLAVTLAATSALFAIVATNISEGQRLALLDTHVANWLHTHAFPALTHVLVVVTNMHAPLAVSIYFVVAASLLARRGEWTWLAALTLAVPIGLGLNALLKLVFQRARPTLDHPLLVLTSYSFPSGHTAGAVLFYGVLTAYVTARRPQWPARTACVLLWVLLVIIVGFSRMYLGVHYLSDILGAVSWALAWLALSLWAAPHIAKTLCARNGG